MSVCFSHSRNLVLALLLWSLMPATALAGKVDAAAAASCSQVGKCPYFSDVYQGDAAFRKSLVESLKGAGIKKPKWVPDGVMSPMTPVSLKGEIHLLGSVCEPHNCPHQIIVLHAPGSRRTVGLYTPDEGTPVWFGQPSAQEQRIVNDFNDGNSRLGRAIQNGKTALPVRVD